MNRRKTALIAVSAAWVAVILVAALSLVLGRVPVMLAVLAGVTALSVTGFWAARRAQDHR